jgi:hypothetical protein
MINNVEKNIYLENEFNNNEEIYYNLKKNNLFTDSDNDEFFKKNEDIKNLLNKNENNINSKTIKSKTKDIEKTKTDAFRLNYNNHDNTIPISKKSQKSEIQNIDKILRFLKKDNDNYISNNNFFNNEKIINTIENIDDLKNQKEILIQKLKKIRMKNKELMSYVEPYKQSMTNEDIENEQRLKYIKYLDDKIKECVLINNKLKQKLMTNQNINIKKKIEYLINKQIKEYEKLYTDDLNMNENFNDIKYKNNYTNNNIDVKCELSLSGANSEYKINNVTTDGFINSKHKNKMSGNLKGNNKNSNVNKLNKNNSLVFCGEEKNKNNSLKPKRNNSKTNFLSSIKYIKNSKITRNNNTSSSITSSHDNNNNNKNNVNKKNDLRSLKQNSKIANGINFKVK